MKRTAPTLGHLDALDGLRGLAVTAVVARHAAPSVFGGGGVVGVTLFFSLSGFLITTLLLQERETDGRVALGSFYARRAARLGPALWALLALYGAGSLLAGAHPRRVVESLLWGVSYGYNWAEVAGRPLLPDLGMLWSLAVEEQFYCLWPLALVLAARRSERAVGIVAATGVLTAATARWALADTWGPALYPMSFTWADALLGGACLAVARRAWLRSDAAIASSGTARRRAWGAGLLVAGAVLTCALLALWPDLKTTVGLYRTGALALAAATAVLVAVAAGLCTGGPASLLHRLLRWRVLVLLGRVSYGLYLWNLVVINVGDRLLGGVLPLAALRLLELAVLAAVVTASWRLVERPAQRWVRGRLVRRAPTPAPAVPAQRRGEPVQAAGSRAVPAGSGPGTTCSAAVPVVAGPGQRTGAG